MLLDSSVYVAKQYQVVGHITRWGPGSNWRFIRDTNHLHIKVWGFEYSLESTENVQPQEYLGNHLHILWEVWYELLHTNILGITWVVLVPSPQWWSHCTPGSLGYRVSKGTPELTWEKQKYLRRRFVEEIHPYQKRLNPIQTFKKHQPKKMILRQALIHLP